jgi:hypothetical protein
VRLTQLRQCTACASASILHTVSVVVMGEAERHPDAAAPVDEDEPSTSLSRGADPDMRAAGEQYFNQMLAKTSRGALPANPPRQRKKQVDQDFASFEHAVEGSKLYLTLALCQGCRAVGVFLLKARSAAW